MTFEDAKTAATASNHVYTSDIPCGAAEPPGIYLVEASGPIGSGEITGSLRGRGRRR